MNSIHDTSVEHNPKELYTEGDEIHAPKKKAVMSLN